MVAEVGRARNWGAEVAARIIRFEGQGQPVPPKGGAWINDSSKGRR